MATATCQTTPWSYVDVAECVNDDAITLFRPYATSQGFVYGQHPSVIALASSERYQIHRDSTAHTFNRWHTTLAG